MNGEILGSPLICSISVLIGGAAGIFFFGTLRIITNRITEMKNPGTIVLLSLFGRMILTIAAAYLTARLSGFGGVLFFLAGFIGVKFLFVFTNRKRERAAE